MDSGASLHMKSESDLTPEEQETIQKSKDPSVIMTANGTTEEATVNVCDKDMAMRMGYPRHVCNRQPNIEEWCRRWTSETLRWRRSCL